MLRGIFEPFGKIDNIQLIMDPETGRSKGYGFITVHIYPFILIDSSDIDNFVSVPQLRGCEESS